jgi:hypothetical protein
MIPKNGWYFNRDGIKYSPVGFRGWKTTTDDPGLETQGSVPV